ncbi:MAG TPA: relaxase/mobilization nuclease domain-containing protein [Steroidobacteraceae bacterium]|nr:relaxase/mobilization nuclease domain-containing protein [Steroidobacteraceae bacterium]
MTRTPEVMVKVTGGGTKAGAVAAHFAYISRRGKLEIETDEGERSTGKEAQKALLHEWHLDLSAGQYRGPRDGRTAARVTRLVHNVVLSMPAPTPPGKVLAAARVFAREKFGAQHRYAMVLHTDQAHPHVHLVVKAEGENGKRLYIDKPMLREWREEFARMMRDQGIAANATPRVVRGRNTGKKHEGIFRAHRHGESYALRKNVMVMATELNTKGYFGEPTHEKLAETRRAVAANWMSIADRLERQGEVGLADEVRHFAKRLPPVRTDTERLAANFVRHVTRSRRTPIWEREPRDRDPPIR